MKEGKTGQIRRKANEALSKVPPKCHDFRQQTGPKQEQSRTWWSKHQNRS